MKKITLIFFLILISILNLFAEIKIIESKNQTEHDAILDFPYHLTQEEINNSPAITKDIPAFTPPLPSVRPVAEFEPMNGVIVRYPLGIPLELIRELSLESRVVTVTTNSYQNQAISAYTNANVNMDNCEFLIAPTDSYWTRDYGPWFSFNGEGNLNVINFTYNRPRPNDNNFMTYYAPYDTLEIFNMGIVQTGGNYMTDGISIAASSHIAYTENSNNQDLVNQAMLDYLGIETYHVVQDPNGTYIDHIDCWGKFLGPDKILIRSVPQSHSSYDELEEVAEYFANQTSGWNRPYRVYRVYTPNDQPYTNSLILNNRVFVPIIGSTYDEAALQTYQEAMPGYEIIGVLNNTSNPWMGTDALHCRTHELADPRMVFIGHTPLAFEVNYRNSYNIQATIKALSGFDLPLDSIKIHTKINSQDFQSSVMTISPTYDDEYIYSINELTPGDTLYYYISATDVSGKTASHPYIGQADAHKVIVASDLTPPVINHEPVTELNDENTPFLFTATVVDDYLLDNVYFEYYTDNDANVISEIMTETDNNIYTYNLDIEIAEITRLYYRIKAIDASYEHNESFMPESDWYAINIITTNSDNNEILTPFYVSVYPNPIILNETSNINLDINSHKNSSVKINLYNVKGQKVSETMANLQKNTLNQLKWDISQAKLSNGIYFMKIENADKPVIKKVLIIK
ncbi:MAG: agmatine deiminase family protein [Candidatus Cloacimonetes bacterium]|nr:agmatine deiminase family protein [Candidatus Cloacimonadota bacterium]